MPEDLTRQIFNRLRYIVDQEGVAISDGALGLIARKGDGSMRDSLSLLDQVLAFCGEEVTVPNPPVPMRRIVKHAAKWRLIARRV